MRRKERRRTRRVKVKAGEEVGSWIGSRDVSSCDVGRERSKKTEIQNKVDWVAISFSSLLPVSFFPYLLPFFRRSFFLSSRLRLLQPRLFNFKMKKEQQ